MYDMKMHWATPESGETKIPGVCRNFGESLRKRMEQVGRKDCERQWLASGSGWRAERRDKSGREGATIYW